MPMKRFFQSNSIIKQISVALLAAYLLLCCLMLINNIFIINTSKERLYDNISDTLLQQSTQTRESLMGAESFIASLAGTETNLRYVETGKTDVDFYVSLERLKNELSAALITQPMIHGFFAFPLENQLFIASARDTDSLVADELRRFTRSALAADELASLPAKKWFPVEVNQRYYLIRFYKIGGSYVGAWTDFTSLLAKLQSQFSMDVNVYYVFDDTNIFGADSKKSDFTFSGVDYDKKHTSLNLDERYLVFSAAMPIADGGHIATLIPYSQITSQLRNNYLLMVITGAVFVGFSLAILKIIQRYLQKPILQLKTSIDTLREGDFNIRIGDNTYDEFLPVNLAFDDMVSKIEGLKIDVYEEKLNQQRTETMFLKSQIAPHFLVNCLNSIYHLTSLGDVEHIRKMTVSLGDHLRYALSDLSTVPLSQEVEMSENFVELSNIRFPGGIAIRFRIDPAATNARVLPMMVLFFIENTIKHEVVNGKLTQINVDARLLPGKEPPRVLLRLWDSGGGWSRENLAVLQNGEMLHAKDGHHIGIRNIHSRLHLMFGDDFAMRFSNHNGAGAQIEIEFPYTAFEGREP